MTKIKFGGQQVENPTPASINRWVTIISVVAPAFMLWAASADNRVMGPHTTSVVTSI